MTVSIFGIRHHGQGSAKSLLKALEKLSPDCVLIEGPPDANDIIHFVNSDEVKAPVSILVYLPDAPQKSVVYPFAVFSPEWQGIKYSLKKNIPVTFIDLPQYFQLKKDDEKENLKENLSKDLTEKLAEEIKEDNPFFSEPKELIENDYKRDPISTFAKLAGYEDTESWWDNFAENRKDNTDIFYAIDMMITNLREEEKKENISKNEQLREAFMRQSIRKAKKEFKNIAVICGAWHISALKTENYDEKEDNKLLSELKKENTKSTWIPWTYDRLSYYSGYGAGIQSPNWYEHLWSNKKDISTKWVVKASRLFRKKDIDVSSAHIIETVRLAETLSLIRDRNSVGLSELQESIKSVICFGNSKKLDLIKQELVIGKKIGKVGSKVPLTPLQTDFELNLKKFRLKKELETKEIDLDLRKENDLEKSYFFHRLNILDIKWCTSSNQSNKKGTFHEFWNLKWEEIFEISLIESGIWGNTVELASSNFVINKAENINDIYELVKILFNTLFANIPNALNKIMEKLRAESALTHDIEKMMKSVSVFVKLLRYGDVRKTDSLQVKSILDGIITRICIGLIQSCTNINKDLAQEVLKDIIDVNESIKLLQDEEYKSMWLKTIQQLSENEVVNKLISGYADRIILDNNLVDIDNFAKKMSYELSIGKDIMESSSWLEGFLKGSALVLIHNDKLLSLIDRWLINIPSETFIEILPILRRNFSNFTNSERRQIGESIVTKKDISDINIKSNIINQEDTFSIERAEKTLPILKILMNIK